MDLGEVRGEYEQNVWYEIPRELIKIFILNPKIVLKKNNQNP